jgi:hypothetical protein
MIGHLPILRCTARSQAVATGLCRASSGEFWLDRTRRSPTACPALLARHGIRWRGRIPCSNLIISVNEIGEDMRELRDDFLRLRPHRRSCPDLDFVDFLRPIGMPRTKQTAKKSTGGLATRHRLVLRGSRPPSPAPPPPPPAKRRSTRKKKSPEVPEDAPPTTPVTPPTAAGVTEDCHDVVRPANSVVPVLVLTLHTVVQLLRRRRGCAGLLEMPTHHL